MTDSTLFWVRKWDLWKRAKQFPPITQQCDYVLNFTLGRDDFGFSCGNFDRRYTGPALNLDNSTVKLICERMPEKPSYPDASRGEEWTCGTEIFAITGTVTGSDTGEVSFALDTDDTDVIGYCLAQIEVTDGDGSVFCPGTVRLNFLEKLG